MLRFLATLNVTHHFLFGKFYNRQAKHKVLTYVEYRAVSGVFQNIDPPPPLHPVSGVLPPHQRRGVHTRRVGEGGFNILEDARHWIGLLQFNPSTKPIIEWKQQQSHC